MRMALVVTTVLAGCSFHASYGGTHYECGVGGTCPSGQVCVQNVCIEGGDVDAPPGSADAPPGTPDAPPGTPDAPLGTPRCGTLDVMQDDFSTDRFGTIWDKWSDGTPTAQVTGGALVITIPANGGDIGAGYNNNFYYDFTGAQAQVTVSQVADVDTILEVRDYNGTKLQFVDERGTLYAWTSTQGDLPGGSVTYDPAVHKHWRLREDAGNAYWEWSTDGSTWNELTHETDPIKPEHVIVELSADGAGPSTAKFEEINTAVTPPAGLCGASTLVDGFDGASFATKWSPWHDTDATIATAGSEAQSMIPNETNQYSGFDTKHLFDLRGDSIYTDSKGTSGVGNFTSFFQLVAPIGGATMIEFARQGTALTCDVYVNNASTPLAKKDITYDATATRYWRVRVSGSTVYWDTAPDASTWTQQFSATTTGYDWSMVHVNSGMGYYGAPQGALTAGWFGVNTP
jgi:hypothetical protein